MNSVLAKIERRIRWIDRRKKVIEAQIIVLSAARDDPVLLKELAETFAEHQVTDDVLGDGDGI